MENDTADGLGITLANPMNRQKNKFCYYLGMENPSSAGRTKQEKQDSRPSGKDKFALVLQLFGNDTARSNFISLCREYLENRAVQPPDFYGENYIPGAKKYSTPQRANLHNRIMETLTRLAADVKRITPQQEKALFEMRSRENAYKAIKDYFLSSGDEPDEDEGALKNQKKSPTAYFHSLGDKE